MCRVLEYIHTKITFLCFISFFKILLCHILGQFDFLLGVLYKALLKGFDFFTRVVVHLSLFISLHKATEIFVRFITYVKI